VPGRNPERRRRRRSSSRSRSRRGRRKVYSKLTH